MQRLQAEDLLISLHLLIDCGSTLEISMLCHGDLDSCEWSDATTRRMLRLLPSLRTGSGNGTRWLVLLTKEMVLIQPGQLITFLFRPGIKWVH